MTLREIGQVGAEFCIFMGICIFLLIAALCFVAALPGEAGGVWTIWAA